VLHYLETGRAARTVALADRGGNPQVALRSSGREVWATDSDTIVVVDTESWRVLRRRRLQSASSKGGQFVGHYSWSADGTCCVARPFSADVVALDDQLRIRKVARVGRQPQEAIELPNGEVIARDWKTGDLLRGKFKDVNWLSRWFV
jgi:hypothetical protein